MLASFLHQNIISHASLGKAMAVLLANKLSSRTLLGTQLMQLISDIYRDEPVSFTIQLIVSGCISKLSRGHHLGPMFNIVSSQLW